MNKRFGALLIASLLSVFCASCNKKNEPKFIAHRGYNKQVLESGEVAWANVENTCDAFLAAAQKPYYGLETDIYLSKDNKWVCCHDPSFKSNGVRVNICDYTLAELKAMPLDDPNGKTNENGNPKQSTIPTLDEYLSIGKQYNKICLIEFKDPVNGAHATKSDYSNCINTVNEVYSLQGVMFISFNFDDLATVREFAPTAKCQYLISNPDKSGIEKQIKMAIDAEMDGSFAAPYIDKKFVKRFHRAKLEVNVWTIDNKEEANEIASYGVDYITSNCLY